MFVDKRFSSDHYTNSFTGKHTDAKISVSKCDFVMHSQPRVCTGQKIGQLLKTQKNNNTI